LPPARSVGFAAVRDCDLGAVLRDLAAFAAAWLAAALFATFADVFDVLSAIAFTPTDRSRNT
jgi:hypothetical protein